MQSYENENTTISINIRVFRHSIIGTKTSRKYFMKIICTYDMSDIPLIIPM